MDTRDTAEEAELRRAARQLARQWGPDTVAALADTTRAGRLAAAVADAGWLELRHDQGDGTPLAGSVEVAIVADALGDRVADVAFAGPVLAADLARRAGVPDPAAAVAFDATLTGIAVVTGAETATALLAVDPPAGEAAAAFVLVPDGDAFRLGRVPIGPAANGTDLTRRVARVASGAPVTPATGTAAALTRPEVDRWHALGLAITSADLVGSMRGVFAMTVEYARERRQFGVPVGSFQAVQHLLAEAQCLLEGSISAAMHASWAADNLPPPDALAAGRVAKAYCARAARTVGETAIQVHGGIGNTWECLVHVYLRRALLSTQWFGDDGEQLRKLAHTRLGVTYGLS